MATTALPLVIAACAPEVPRPPDRTTCELTFTDDGDVRVFVVGHLIRAGDADSYSAYEASFREDMARVAPCLSRRRPNLVVFPEDAGLNAWFIGRRALFARGASDAATAFNAMYAGYYRQADHYRATFPGISPARALTLAISDVAWRAMDRTFGNIARDYGVWVITSANLPVSELRQDDPHRGLLRDPDAPADSGVYVAIGPECYNTALLYGPDGQRLGRIDKVYLTDPELDLLDMSSGRLDRLRVFELPFGRVGSAISRDAFYAPFSQRMEDLGAELVVQPEAFSGWTISDRANSWLPDVILASGWSATQKYRGLRYNAAPMLTGNLFDFVFDGQVWITQDATPDQALMGFVGSERTHGWIAIGPWAFDDPITQDPTLSLDARRAILRAQGEQLRPVPRTDLSGRYARTLVGADLQLYGEDRQPPLRPVITEPGATSSRPVAADATRGHQTNPDAAYDAAGRLYVVFSDGRAGDAQIYLATSDDDGVTWAPARAVAPAPARQLRPTVAAGAAGQVVVAWQQGAPGEERVHLARSTDGGATFVYNGAIEPAGGGAQWEPDIAFEAGGQGVALVWTDFREGLAPKVRIARSLDGGARWSPSERVDVSNTVTDRATGTQIQPSVIWTSRALVVAWLDYRARDWPPWAAVAPGGGAFGAAARVGPPSDVEVLGSDPQLAAGPSGEVLLAWDDLRARRGHHDVRAARWGAGMDAWQNFPLLAGGADEGAFVSRFRPSIGTSGGRYVLVFQDMSAGKNALGLVSLAPAAAEPDAARPAPIRFDDTGRSPNQLTRPRIAARQDGTRAVVVFEDDREGWTRVRCSDAF